MIGRSAARPRGREQPVRPDRDFSERDSWSAIAQATTELRLPERQPALQPCAATAPGRTTPRLSEFLATVHVSVPDSGTHRVRLGEGALHAMLEHGNMREVPLLRAACRRSSPPAGVRRGRRPPRPDDRSVEPPSPHSTPTTTTTTTTTSDRHATTATTTTTTAAASGEPPCRAATLSLVVPRPAGRAWATARLASCSRTPSSVELPDLRVARDPVPRTRTEHPLPTIPHHTTNDFFGSDPAVPLVIAPGASASFRLDVGHGVATPNGCATAYALQVIPPNDTATLRDGDSERRVRVPGRERLAAPLRRRGLSVRMGCCRSRLTPRSG